MRNECVPIKHSIEPWPLQDHYGFWRWDVRKRLPFADQVVDWVHIYHVFEHLNPSESRNYIGELHRIVKVGGILRVSVADHESFVSDYLGYLDKAAFDPSERNVTNYEWALMRIIDQMVRHKPGGRMLELLHSGRYDPDYLHGEFGDVFDPPDASVTHPSSRNGYGPRDLFFALLRRVRRRWHGDDPRKWAECDRWANDRVFMRELSRQAGFRLFSKVRFDESAIPGWERYDFDRSVHGGEAEFEPSSYFEYTK